MTFDSTPIQVDVVHAAVPGRLRLHVARLHRCGRLKTRLEHALLQTRDVRAASANVWTGNVLIVYDPQQDVDRVQASIRNAIDSATVLTADGAGPSIDSRTPAGVRPTPLDGGLGWLFRSLGNRLGASLRPSAIAVDHHVAPQSLARPWHALAATEVARFWETPLKEGVSSASARERLSRYGPNTLPTFKARSPLEIIAAQFRSLPVLLLLGSAALSVSMGAVGDALVICAVVVLNATVGFATEMQAEQTIATLLDSAEPVVTAIRDGELVRLPGDAIVPGDLLVLTRGSQVAADARVVEADWLTADESLLTGESLPVEKRTPALSADAVPLAARSNMVFRGTLVTGGSGVALAVTTGSWTEIGKIQQLISQSLRPDTPLERQLAGLSNQLVWVTGVVAASVLGVGLLRGFSFLQMVNSAISLAVAAVPEGLPVVATTALASAVRTLLRQNVLVRRLDSVETLGAAGVVCFDKTGTLTFNHMSVNQVFTGARRPGRHSDRVRAIGRSAPTARSGDLDRLATVGLLCSEAEIVRENGSSRVSGSPTEVALIEMALRRGLDVAAVRSQYPLRKTEQRGEHRNYMITWHDMSDGRTLLAVKGSPEEVLALCRFHRQSGRVLALTKRDRTTIAGENSRMAEAALRVLGLAYLETEHGAEGQEREHGLIWLGLVGMADPPREGLAGFINALRRAGIRPMMITGDQLLTARAIGRDLGLTVGDDAGNLDALSADEILDAVSKGEIFARVNPTDKLRIVRARQQEGFLVAMTGDGINDGPALRAADVGITLGRGSTQLARDAADIVLLDDNIQTLVPAIRDGRRIHENIRRAIHYIFATNISEVILTFVSLATGMGQPLTARQLLWINVLTDVFPELALAMQAAEGDFMGRPPRAPGASVIEIADLPRLSRQSALISTAGLACYGYGVARYGIGAKSSTLAFLGLAATQLLHAFSARSERHSVLTPHALPPNRLLTASVTGAVGTLLIAQFIPGLRSLLGTVPIGLADYAVCGGAAISCLLVNETLKIAERDEATPGVHQPALQLTSGEV